MFLLDMLQIVEIFIRIITKFGFYLFSYFFYFIYNGSFVISYSFRPGTI